MGDILEIYDLSEIFLKACLTFCIGFMPAGRDGHFFIQVFSLGLKKLRFFSHELRGTQDSVFHLAMPALLTTCSLQKT